MRINIPIGHAVRDNHIRALYIINFALGLCLERMIVPTLEFFADKYGYRLIRK